MNKQELVKTLMKRMEDFGYFPTFTNVKIFLQEYEKMAKLEPQAGCADETPRYLRNVIERLRELPLHDREVWLKAIMGEFEEDFSHAKWREGYEQGKFEGMIEREKVTIPQFVADWIEYCKFTHVDLQYALIVDDVYFYNYANQKDFSKLKEFLDTENNPELFARAWLDGYEVEEEKRYYVRFKGMESDDFNYLNFIKFQHAWVLSSLKIDKKFRTEHTRKELEDAGFGWVFSCEGIEVEEVE